MNYMRHSTVPMRAVVRHIRHRHAKDGSALVLTLLVTALLTTIAVSFLSTSRIEQIAAKNFTRQNAASGLAEMATQEAMANIALGFNFSGNLTQGLDDDEYAQVVTTQSGAIHKYIFQNGSVTRNATIDLFSAGNMVIHLSSTNNTTTEALKGNATTDGTVNLNNLQNPSAISAYTNNKWTITGNASEAIRVPLEVVQISENGTDQVVGRIAYYVEDEGTKVNFNSVRGKRATLNVGSSKSLSLFSVAEEIKSIADLSRFDDLVDDNGTISSNSSSVDNWLHFFRKDQLIFQTYNNATLTQNATGMNATETEEFREKLYTSSSDAPISDHHMKKTPWGTDRLFINDLPLNETGVNAIYEALSGKNATTGLYHTGNGTPSPNQYELNGLKLRDIYGNNTTFAEKYTDTGLKQIAANILQARDPDTLNNWTKSFDYNGTLIGAEAEATDTTTGLVAIADCCSAVKKVIPKDYMGVAPYPFINELGVTVVWTCEFAGGRFIPRLNIRPFISIVNLNRISMVQSNVDEWEIEMQIDSFQFDVTDSNGNTYPYGPSGFENGDAWGHTWVENYTNARARDSSRGGGFVESNLGGSGPWSYRLSGFSNIGGTSYTTSGNRAPDWGAAMAWSQEWQFPCPPYPNTNWSLCAQLNVPNDGTQITDIRNIRVKFEYIRLLAKSGDDTTIRDWVLAEDAEIEGWLQAPHPFDAGVYPNGWPEDLNAQKINANAAPNGQKTFPLARNQTIPPPKTVKRIDGRLRTSQSMVGLSDRQIYMQPWSSQDTQSWIDPNAGEIVRQGYDANVYNSVAYTANTFDGRIPGDPQQSDQRLFFAYDPSWHHVSSTAWPSIQFTNPTDLKRPNDATSGKGVFTCPADLGKIQTNVQHRKLRMTTQHPNEVHTDYGGLGNATFVPDWAMLDVVSFGSNVTTVPAPAPINLNGKFHVPTSSSIPAPRTAGLKSMLHTLEYSSLIGNPFDPSITAAVPRTGSGAYFDPSANWSNTIIDNINNLSWTSGNQKFRSTSDTSTWGYDRNNNLDNPPNSRRAESELPSNQLVLPSEVTEISGISDFRFFNRGGVPNMKGNEGVLSAFFPGATTQSRHFTIYAYAQALDQQRNIESDRVTKTLVEVEEVEPATNPPTYKVKKLYTQQIAAE